MSRRVLGSEVTFELPKGHPHQVSFVAVFERSDDAGHPYIELHLNCCGQPALIALAVTGANSRVMELKEATTNKDITYVLGEHEDVPCKSSRNQSTV